MSKYKYILIREEMGDDITYGTFSDLESAIKEFYGLAPDFYSHVPHCPTQKQLFDEYNEAIIDDIEMCGIWHEHCDEASRDQFIIIEEEDS